MCRVMDAVVFMAVVSMHAMLCGRCHAADEITFDDLLEAIRIVETGGEPNNGEDAIGDNGKAIGPFQIWKIYWRDAVENDASIGGRYEDCNGMEYSRRVVTAYMGHYGKKFIGTEDYWERLARMHNGGPQGYTKDSTKAYWEKVKKHLPKRMQPGSGDDIPSGEAGYLAFGSI